MYISQLCLTKVQIKISTSFKKNEVLKKKKVIFSCNLSSKSPQIMENSCAEIIPTYFLLVIMEYMFLQGLILWNNLCIP